MPVTIRLDVMVCFCTVASRARASLSLSMQAMSHPSSFDDLFHRLYRRFCLTITLWVGGGRCDVLEFPFYWRMFEMSAT